MLDRPRITHVIYDLDGLLLDTESINEAVNRAIADRYGCVYDPAVRGQIAGRDAHTSSAILVEWLGLPISPEAMLEQRRQLVAQWRDAVQKQYLPEVSNRVKARTMSTPLLTEKIA